MKVSRRYHAPMRPRYWFLISIVLLVVGVGLILVPRFGPEPDVSCVEEGKSTSGYAIQIDGKECRLSTEDFQKVWHYEYKSALPIRRTGLGVFVVGLGCGVTGIVTTLRRKRAATRGASRSETRGPHDDAQAGTLGMG